MVVKLGPSCGDHDHDHIIYEDLGLTDGVGQGVGGDRVEDTIFQDGNVLGAEVLSVAVA